MTFQLSMSFLGTIIPPTAINEIPNKLMTRLRILLAGQLRLAFCKFSALHRLTAQQHSLPWVFSIRQQQHPDGQVQRSMHPHALPIMHAPSFSGSLSDERPVLPRGPSSRRWSQGAPHRDGRQQTGSYLQQPHCFTITRFNEQIILTCSLRDASAAPDRLVWSLPSTQSCG